MPEESFGCIEALHKRFLKTTGSRTNLEGRGGGEREKALVCFAGGKAVIYV